jgi:hypothetical protein
MNVNSEQEKRNKDVFSAIENNEHAKGTPYSPTESCYDYKETSLA